MYSLDGPRTMRLTRTCLAPDVLRSMHAAVVPVHGLTAVCAPHLAARLCASRASDRHSAFSDTATEENKQPRQRGRPRKTRVAEPAPSSTGAQPSVTKAAAAGPSSVMDAESQQTLTRRRTYSSSRSRRPSSRDDSSQKSSTNSDSSTTATPSKQARKRRAGSTLAAVYSSDAAQSVHSSSAQQQQPSASSGSSSTLHSSDAQSGGAGPQPTPAAAAAHQEPGDQEEEHADGVAGSVPSQDVWARELRQFQNMMLNPARLLVKSFVLQHCYVLNSPATREHYRNLEAAQMHKVIKTRTQLERRLSLAANSLSAAWQRLQYLAAAVADGGAILTEEQMNKERETLVDVVEGMKVAQVLLERATTRAGHAADQRFLNRAHRMRGVLTSFRATAESYLREYMRRIAAASRINEQSRLQWEAAPMSKRPQLHEVEARRQQQLQQLQALAPLHPTQLLAEYRQAALEFELYKDKSFFQRKPATGMPSSTGGEFWQQSSSSNSSSATAPLYASNRVSSNSSSSNDSEMDTEQSSDQQQRLQQQQLARDEPAEPADYGTTEIPAQQLPIDSSRQLFQQQQQQQLWGSPPLGWPPPPAQQQLMARPVQQLPLLPHLGKHRQWMHLLQQQQEQQQQLELLQQQQGQQGQQQQQQGVSLLQQRTLTKQAPNSGLLSRPQLPYQHQQEPEQAADAHGPSSKSVSSSRVVSLSGKVMPPVAVLLQRAIKIEQQLMEQEADQQGSRW